MSADVRKAENYERWETVLIGAFIEEHVPAGSKLGSSCSAEDWSVVPRLCPTRRNRTIPNVTERNGPFL
jgi:hypothetical protein